MNQTTVTFDDIAAEDLGVVWQSRSAFPDGALVRIFPASTGAGMFVLACVSSKHGKDIRKGVWRLSSDPVALIRYAQAELLPL